MTSTFSTPFRVIANKPERRETKESFSFTLSRHTGPIEEFESLTDPPIVPGRDNFS
eukprot:CAMPEP_0172537672 /NCGR_PEP_ID=MMETSP1067-20121228/9239_1 /TAXON_ID=265564 ORGANISM="Thalassiosira punctigera, Strain Tpunct2005C2" /NCGR_SAMPLE_ID=MMETSP1067 /ASSEMBLY_ACC=CAM_ASM_000444 /LENGTH=55 /DNA_ID=CAMNT_0013323025 /DNA_START=9 /DNA_END=173 /DNA_ORIENTATION=+